MVICHSMSFLFILDFIHLWDTGLANIFLLLYIVHSFLVLETEKISVFPYSVWSYQWAFNMWCFFCEVHSSYYSSALIESWVEVEQPGMELMTIWWDTGIPGSSFMSYVTVDPIILQHFIFLSSHGPDSFGSVLPWLMYIHDLLTVKVSRDKLAMGDGQNLVNGIYSKWRYSKYLKIKIL